MSFMSNTSINLYSIALLVIISFHVIKNTQKNFLQHRLYMSIVQVTILSLVLDILSRFDGHPETLYSDINYWGNFFMYLLNPLLPAIWLLYTHFQVFYDEKKTMRLMYPLAFLFVVNGVMIVVSQFTGWYYYIDSNNIYHRGDYFWVATTIAFSILIAALVLVIVNRKIVEKKHFFALVTFPILPILGVFMQITIYGTSLVLNGVALSLLIVFLNIQNHSMNTDFLTGVYNRKKLETYMKDKINSCTPNKTFSTILLDIDHFKNINDTFGHAMGDDALETTVRILRNCLGATDFIARYGGDEFYVILETCNHVELKETVRMIKNHTEKYNEQSDKPYKLSFSMGYAVYDYQSQLDVKAFQKLVDRFMYKNKHANRNPV